MGVAPRLLFLILHNIRSVYNVGSIFRTAEAVGVTKIYLTGHTPGPLDRFSRLRRDFAKTALDAERFVPWEVVVRPAVLFKRLRREGVVLIAVEQAPDALDYRRFSLPRRAALMFGNELAGIPASVRRVCDAVVLIPLHGKKESLNVAVAAGVVLFGIGAKARGGRSGSWVV